MRAPTLTIPTLLLIALAPTHAATTPYLPQPGYLEYVHVENTGSNGTTLEIILPDATAIDEVPLPPSSHVEEALLTPEEVYTTYLRQEAATNALEDLAPPSDKATGFQPTLGTTTVDVTTVAAAIGYRSEQITVPGSVEAPTVKPPRDSTGDSLYLRVSTPPGPLYLPIRFPPGTAQVIVAGASDPAVYVNVNGEWIEVLPGPLATYVTSNPGTLTVAYAPDQYTLTLGWSGPEAGEVLLRFEPTPVQVASSPQVSVQLPQQTGGEQGTPVLPVPVPPFRRIRKQPLLP